MHKHRGMFKKKGRQDGDDVHVAWLMNRFEHAVTPDPITQSLYCCLVFTLELLLDSC